MIADDLTSSATRRPSPRRPREDSGPIAHPLDESGSAPAPVLLPGKLARRDAKSWTQEQLADIAKVTARTLQRIESGEVPPSAETLLALAGAFDLTVDDLRRTPEEWAHRWEADPSVAGVGSAIVRAAGAIKRRRRAFARVLGRAPMCRAIFRR